MNRDILDHYDRNASVTLHPGDRLALLAQIPNGAARLIVTSPPYNIGKKYEKRLVFEQYLGVAESHAFRVLPDPR